MNHHLGCALFLTKMTLQRFVLVNVLFSLPSTCTAYSIVFIFSSYLWCLKPHMHWEKLNYRTKTKYKIKL